MAQYGTKVGIMNIGATPKTFYQGDTLNALLTFTSNGTAIDMTGYTFDSWITNSGAQVEEITVDDTDLANGQITLQLDGTTSAGITAGTYNWYLRWTDTNTIDTTVVAGLFIVTSI